MKHSKITTIYTNSKFSTFIKRNLYLLFVSIYSIDTNYLYKALTIYIKEFADNQSLTFTHIQSTNKQNHFFYQKVFTLHFLIYILRNKNLQHQAYYIIKSILSTKIYSKAKSNYIQKYVYTYNKQTNPYLTGYKTYQKKQLIQLFSLTRLLVIYKIYSIYSKAYLLFYLFS